MLIQILRQIDSFNIRSIEYDEACVDHRAVYLVVLSPRSLLPRNALMLKFERRFHVLSGLLVYFLTTAALSDAHQLQIWFVAPETLAYLGVLLKAVMRRANHSSRGALLTMLRR